jgi:hypothetical protein
MPRTARRWASVALAVLVLGAAGLRLAGIGYLLPGVMNRDGLVLVRQVDILRGDPPTMDGDAWRYPFYPLLMARIAAALPRTESPPAEPTPLARHLELASAPWIRLREISVLLSLLAIPATYLLARRFVDRASALFAAALVATSLHHIVLAIQEKPHAAATSFVALALLAALRLRRKPDALAYVACGVAAGLAIGTLQNAGACLLAIGAAFCLRDRTRGGASAWWLAATVAILAGAVRLFYPFLFETSGAARTPGTLDLAHKIAEGFDGAPWPRILAAVWALDPVLVTCAAVGILLWLAAAVRDPARRRSALRGDLAVCFALVVPYALVLGLYRESLVRVCLPFVPLLACCAAFAFQRLRGAHAAVRASVAVALVAAALWPALHFARIRCVPGPMEEAARWIEANTDPGETIVVMPKYDLPILPTSAALEQNARPAYRTIWAEYLAHVPARSLAGPRRSILVEPGELPESRLDFVKAPLEHLRRYDARHLVLDLSGFANGFLLGQAELAVRISPAIHDDGRKRGVVLWGTGYDPLRPSAFSILGLRSLGTAVEIYRVPR